MRLHVVVVIIFFERPPIIWIDWLIYSYADVYCILLDIWYVYADVHLDDVHLYAVEYILYINTNGNQVTYFR